MKVTSPLDPQPDTSRAINVATDPAAHPTRPAEARDTAIRGASPRRFILTVLAVAAGATALLIWRTPRAAMFFVGFATITALLIPPVAALAWRKGMLAFPGGRDIHGEATPRGGGIALFVPLVATLLFVALSGDQRGWGLLAGGTLIFTLGMLDDVHRASPKFKILVQLFAGLALILSGFRLPGLGIPGLGTVELSLAAQIPIMLIWIVIATNAFNLSDGLDGLATSLAILGLAVLTAGNVPGFLPIALAGGCAGFLLYNLPSARIFLGDSGSLLLGFLLAALTLELPVRANVPLAIAVFAYSLGDVAIVTFRRWIRAKPLFSPDQSHVHHKVLHHLKSPLRTLVALLTLAGLQCLVAILWPGLISLTASALIWLVVAALLIRAGNYKARAVLGGRPRMREMHLMRSYVFGMLNLADTEDQVARALLHLVDITDLDTVSIDGLTVNNLAHDDSEAPEHLKHHIASLHHKGWWHSASPMANQALEQERATIIKDALLLAGERLARSR